MPLSIEEKPAVGGLTITLGDHLILSDTVEARSRPDISWKSPSIENPVVPASNGARQFMYKQHALCTRCRRLLRASSLLLAKMQKPGELELGYNLPELLASAARGCHLCSIFMSHLEGPCWRGDGIVRDVKGVYISFHPDNTDSWISSALDAVKKAGGMIISPLGDFTSISTNTLGNIPYTVNVEVDSNLDSGGRASWSYISATSGPADRNETGMAGSASGNLGQRFLPKRDSFNESTGSDDSIELARWWLDYCLRHHDTCSDSVLPQVLPTRLVEISSAGSPGNVRVFSPADGQTFIPYLALSHCWGGTQILKLNTNNYNDMYIQIPRVSLSKTFQDAIEITRCLGYKYLWIDSLCIQQDSWEDWEREALRMGEYYGNAICTIAALASVDGLGGCFKSRNPLRMLECVVNSSNERSLRISAHQPMRYEFDSNLAPLHKRAWVVQERLLSRRTLYYGSTGLYWECRTASTAEWRPDGIAAVPPTQKDQNRPVDKSLKRHYWDLDKVSDSAENIWDFHRLWYGIVEIYTGAFLTFPTDKLIAIAGLVAPLEKRFDLSFQAGIWSRYSTIDLIWKVDVMKTRKSQHQEHPPRRLPNEAPTWSWASSPYPVEHPHMIYWKGGGENLHITELCSVKIMNEEYREGRGATDNAIRNLKAVGAQCELTLSVPPFKCTIFSRNINDVISRYLRPFRADGEVSDTALCDITMDIPALAEEGEEVLCLFILGQAYYEETARHPWSRKFHGIAVQQAEDVWRRVGYFETNSDKDLNQVRSQVEGSKDPIHRLRSIVLS